MARVAAEELERRGIESGLPRLWGRFDDMAGDLLDILAEDLGLTWYDSDAPAAVKRELLKNSGQVFRRLGTKWAVENVIGTYFGEGFVREWFEYDGEPGHFRVYSPNPSVNQERLEELLDVLGLRGREKYLPNQLSGGQQQRVSIGRALMNAPAVVLADEPTGNLDSKNSQEIVELLKMSNKKYGQTLVIITHDENIALQAHRVIAIEDGRITRDERIREVLE